MSKFVSLLMHTRTQAHEFHLQTRSYAMHKALEDYYTAIVPLLDAYTEAYQGKYGIIKRYYNFPVVKGASKRTVLRYFRLVRQEVLKYRAGLRDTYLQAGVDDVLTLVNSTLYKLVNLA